MQLNFDFNNNKVGSNTHHINIMNLLLIHQLAATQENVSMTFASTPILLDSTTNVSKFAVTKKL